MASATERYRRNTITSLQDDQGRDLTDHDEKATVLSNTYKERMGRTGEPDMLFDLDALFQQTIDLDHLQQLFTHEEIDQVIKEMPADKAPRPDGHMLYF